MGEVNRSTVFITFKHRKVDDPTKLKTIRVNKTKLTSYTLAHNARKFSRTFFSVTGKENGISANKPQLRTQCLNRRTAQILGNRPCPRTSPLYITPKNVSKSWFFLFLFSPTIHTITKGTAAPPTNGNSPHHGPLGNHLGKNSKTPFAKMLCHLLNLNRIT